LVIILSDNSLLPLVLGPFNTLTYPSIRLPHQRVYSRMIEHGGLLLSRFLPVVFIFVLEWRVKIVP